MTTRATIERYMERNRDRKAARMLETVAVVIASADRIGEAPEQTLANLRSLLAQFYKGRGPR